MLPDMKTYTDAQLKQALAKMLPELIHIWDSSNCYTTDAFFQWKDKHDNGALLESRRVLDTELLHLCWLVEKTLTSNQKSKYMIYFWGNQNKIFCNRFGVHHATWQQRTIALAKVKGIEL